MEAVDTIYRHDADDDEAFCEHGQYMDEPCEECEIEQDDIHARTEAARTLNALAGK